MGHWALQQVVAPALEPVALAEVKAHVRQDLTVDDGYLAALITAARLQFERDTGRQLVTSSFLLTLDHFPFWDLAGWRCGQQPYLPAWQWAEHRAVYLPRPPLQAGSVSIGYDDSAGVAQVMATNPATFQVDSQSEPARVQPVYGTYWPITRSQLGAVRINYTAGWAHTTVADGITAGTQTVTPATMAGIVAGMSLEVDLGTALEVVIVASVTAITFTATFAQTHAGNVPISGVPRDVKQAILLLAAHWYGSREAVADRTFTALPLAYQMLALGRWVGDMH